jgi:hypothetical protein
VTTVQAGTVSAPAITTSGDTNTGIYFPAADQAAITTGGTARLTVTTAQFTGTLPWRGQNGTAAAPALSASGDTNTGIYFPAADTIAFAEGGAEVMRITSAGDVGVGTTTPAQKLDVNGAIKASMVVTESSMGFRNRIINGDMRVSQRGTSGSDGGYTVDRFRYSASLAGKATWAQNQGSVTPPAGFQNYLGFTSSSAYSVGASERFSVEQYIEGFNVADLAWGTANAQSITISFWVRSSLTGTFGASIQNSAINRSYPFNYIVSAANTWEQKTVVVPGDTTGTWLTSNGAGLRLMFGLGVGSILSGTAGSWSGSNFQSATGAVSVVGTSGATFYITGVQLEAGSVATPFERRPYGTELALCQRYYYKTSGDGTDADLLGLMWCISSTRADAWTPFPVTMRTSPTALEQTGTAADYAVATLATGITCSAVPVFVRANVNGARTQATVSSGLTAGNGCSITVQPSGTAYLAWSAEL